MPEKLQYDDAVSMFKDTVVQYKGTPCKVTRITEGLSCRLKSLKDGKLIEIPLDQDEFQKCAGRLGFMNHDSNGVVYIQRRPLRGGGRPPEGLHYRYLHHSQLPCHYPEGWDVVYKSSVQMDDINFYKMLIGDYPSLEQARDSVKEFGGCVAFDKQFALDSEMNIYWKANYVGRLPRGSKTIDKIVFEKGMEGLVNLIGDVNEKIS